MPATSLSIPVRPVWAAPSTHRPSAPLLAPAAVALVQLSSITRQPSARTMSFGISVWLPPSVRMKAESTFSPPVCRMTARNKALPVVAGGTGSVPS